MLVASDRLAALVGASSFAQDHLILPILVLVILASYPRPGIGAAGRLAAQKPALWSTAPAWRRLVVGSGLLISLAIRAPVILAGLEPASDSRATSQAVGLPTEVEPTAQAALRGFQLHLST
jgi:hypothetical protein